MLKVILILVALLILALKIIRRVFFPTELNFVMKMLHSKITEVKSKNFNEAFSKIATDTHYSKLKILELGIGTGENFKYFPKGSKIIISDKTDEFLSYLNESIKNNNCQNLDISKLIVNKAESMIDIQTNSMDAVVHTFLLCSVDDYTQVLSEIYRVLKPGGVAIFFEHSLDNINLLRKIVQKIIEPLCGQCKFLNMKKVLKSGKFQELVIKEHIMSKFYMTIVNPIVYGYGVKACNL
ncbi:unnamed protein product [Brachionus calyciflorus]|uniref:Methyltransferase type 11 domain-containing protein n=1 Tax=Brachionus calyciflorus TaxID=104777 RepID=A0A813NSI2_9BILA|nr:unnamed protein product [Brachionus calyciflorus]